MYLKSMWVTLILFLTISTRLSNCKTNSFNKDEIEYYKSIGYDLVNDRFLDITQVIPMVKHEIPIVKQEQVVNSEKQINSKARDPKSIIENKIIPDELNVNIDVRDFQNSVPNVEIESEPEIKKFSQRPVEPTPIKTKQPITEVPETEQTKPTQPPRTSPPTRPPTQSSATQPPTQTPPQPNRPTIAPINADYFDDTDDEDTGEVTRKPTRSFAPINADADEEETETLTTKNKNKNNNNNNDNQLNSKSKGNNNADVEDVEEDDEEDDDTILVAAQAQVTRDPNLIDSTEDESSTIDELLAATSQSAGYSNYQINVLLFLSSCIFVLFTLG